jgi:hypothetical protein
VREAKPALRLSLSDAARVLARSVFSRWETPTTAPPVEQGRCQCGNATTDRDLAPLVADSKELAQEERRRTHQNHGEQEKKSEYHRDHLKQVGGE